MAHYRPSGARSPRYLLRHACRIASPGKGVHARTSPGLTYAATPASRSSHRQAPAFFSVRNVSSSVNAAANQIENLGWRVIRDSPWQSDRAPVQSDRNVPAQSRLPALAGLPAFHPSKHGMRPSGKPPVSTVKPGKAPQSMRHLLHAHGAPGIARVSAALHDVFHHQQKVQSQIIDHRFVDQRVVDIERHR